MSFRTQQSQVLGNKILQDEQLISFIQDNNINTLILDGESDIECFQSRLLNCNIGLIEKNGMLAVFVNQLFSNLEDVLTTLEKKLQDTNPDWVYVAVNKYLITTTQSWDNLTDNYDQDLIDIISSFILPLDFLKIKQSYIAYDDGRYFNFVHPTTNAFYKKQS